MPYRLYDDEKIKLIVLYLLDELDDAYDFETISEIIVWDGSISYFVFTDCFNQLLTSGAIQKEIDETSNIILYRISPLGKHSVSVLEDKIINFIKERIMRSATRLLAFKKDGSNLSSEIKECENGYELICRMKNKKHHLFSMNLFLDNKSEAELLKLGFDQRAEHIYSSILAILSDNTKFML